MPSALAPEVPKKDLINLQLGYDNWCTLLANIVALMA